MAPRQVSNPAASRFKPAYVNTRGNLTLSKSTRQGRKFRRDPKRYWFDSQTQSYVTDRIRYRAVYGHTKEQATRAIETGQGTTFQRLLGISPEQRAQQARLRDLAKSYAAKINRDNAELDIRITNLQAERSQEFKDLVILLRDFERTRKLLLSSYGPDSDQYLDFVSPDGEYAMLLIALGRREMDNRDWPRINVGDS